MMDASEEALKDLVTRFGKHAEHGGMFVVAGAILLAGEEIVGSADRMAQAIFAVARALSKSER